MLNDPVIKRSVILIFKGAKAVCYTLDCILNGVCKVIHREDAPFFALSVMVDIAYAVKHRVTHIEVAGGKIYLCAESVLPFGKFAGSHAAEKVKTFVGRSVAVWRYGGMRKGAAGFRKILG